MRKIRVVLVALAALCAFSAFASSAFALTWVSALWLVDGVNEAPANTVVTTTGGLTLKNVLNGAAMLCEGVFDGTVTTGGVSGEAEVTKVLSSGGAEIEQLDESGATKGISCVATTPTATCETGSEAWPGGLPWKFHIEQDEPETTLFRQVLLSKPTYFILCLVLGLSVDELCEATEGAVQEIKNIATGVEGVGSVSPNGPCGTNASEGELIADSGNVTAVAGKTLSVSL